MTAHDEQTDLPTTEDIRNGYAAAVDYDGFTGENEPELEAKFDAWLAHHDAELLASRHTSSLEALRGAATTAVDRWLSTPDDYRTALAVIAPIYEKEIEKLNGQ